MSAALLRKSLQLFDEITDEGKTTKKSKSKDILSEKTLKRGIKKRRKQLKAHVSSHHGTRKQKESALELFDRKKRLDHTEESLQYLNQISSIGRPNAKSVDVILEHNRGKLSKNVQKVTKNEDKTVFTEKDFKNFEKEYFKS